VTARKWSIAAAVFFTVAYLFLFFVSARPPLDQWHVTKVFIPKGSTYPEIEKILAEKGALRYPLAFRVLVIGTMTGTKLQHGEYALPAPPSAIELWRKLVSGDVAKYQVTIPGGSTLSDIAETLGTLELANPSEFLTAAVSPSLTSRMGIPGNTLEGYLFPDTYIMVKDMTPEEILSVMVRRFRRKFTPEMESKAEEDGFTLHQIVTIASIIEKEAGLVQEKPLVSEVIRKRLSLNMPLQPGPICNPGLSSLIAAVGPADTDYLYFVSRNDGSHQFSRTLQEHNRAVAVYQKGEKMTMGQNEKSDGEIEAGAKDSTPLPRP
jgi:UPF0755 protein